MSLTSYYQPRDELADGLTRELFGPAHDQQPTPIEQTLVDPPITRYLAGVLYPQSPDVDNADDDHNLAGFRRGRDQDGAGSEPVALANVRNPSSFSLTFTVDTEVTTTVVVEAWAARYRPTIPGGQGALEELEEDGREEGPEEADALRHGLDPFSHTA